MNTPAHLIVGAAAFGRPGHRMITLAATLGALLPDVSLYLMAGVSLFILQIPSQRVFDQLYFSDAWQQVFAVDNSFLLWGFVFGVALWRKIPWLIALTASGLLHLGFDFLLHNQDARMNFWPLSTWKFHSPVSYWQPEYYGAIVAPIEKAMSALLGVYLLVRHKDIWLRALFVALLAIELVPHNLSHGFVL